MRVYMITSQQFIYACVFSNQRPGSILGHFLQYHSATISSGRQKVNLNTRVQKYILEKKLHATQKVQSSMGSKSLLSATKSTDAAAAIVRSTSIQNNIQLKNKLLVILKELGRIGQAVLFSPVSFFVWVPIHFMRNNYSEMLGVILLGLFAFDFAVILPVVFFEGTPNFGG